MHLKKERKDASLCIKPELTGLGDQCHIYLYTSVKIIQLNEYGCRDAPCEKSWKQGNPLSNTIKDTTHDCASILDSIAKGISLFPRFFAWCIPTSILNDFYTCSTYFS